MNRENIISIAIAAFLCITACSSRSEYNRTLARELASGKRSDSLFLGLYFGMPEKEFYLHCWKLNKKGMIRQGETNTTVKYILKNELHYPAQSDFYPRFNKGLIYEMPVRYTYTGWVPWNKELSSEKLQEQVLKWYKELYGKDFIKVKHPRRGIAWVRIDGNKRITIFRQDELHVWAVFTDMKVRTDWPGINQDTTSVPGNIPSNR